MPARRTRCLTRTAAGALAVVAIAAPAAVARPALESAGGTRSGSTADLEPRMPAPSVTRITDDGFEWGSAVIGAGGAAAVLLLTGAGATTLSRRRQRVGVTR